MWRFFYICFIFCFDSSTANPEERSGIPMFGYRPDGRRVSSIDPIVRITPYLMPMRCDAQVFLQH